MDEGEYWDGVARGRIKEVNGGFSVMSNWTKRRAVLRELFGYDFTGCNVLEIGVGAGEIIGLLARTYPSNSVRFTGTDTSSVFANFTKKLCRVETHVAKMNDLPFQDNTFDVVCCFDVLEHVAVREREESYRELKRVFRKPGVIFVNNPDSESAHDGLFDHGWGWNDIEEFCNTIGVRLLSSTPISGDGGVQSSFMVFGARR